MNALERARFSLSSCDRFLSSQRCSAKAHTISEPLHPDQRGEMVVSSVKDIELERPVDCYVTSGATFKTQTGACDTPSL
jgi:hypothetical protein